jgi:hypothetical protein
VRRCAASGAPWAPPRPAKPPSSPTLPAPWLFRCRRASRGSATARCFCWASQAPELIGLDVVDLTETEEGLPVTIRRSKTDQEGHGQMIAIIRGTGGTCPVKAVKAWLEAAGITEGLIFRPVAKGGRLGTGRLSGKSVCTLVQDYAGRLGLDAEAFGAHSLRSGFLTSAARRGASVFKMRDVSRHRSMDVLQAYVRDADLFRDHAGAGLL